MKLPTLNPVLARESRVRMRGWKAPALITLYVAVLGFVSWFIIAVTGMSGRAFAPELGGVIFATLGFTQFALLLFSAPGLTAGAIAGEREKQTLDLLLITRLSPFQVVIGKLEAAVAFTLLLMFASLPVYSLLFLLGGISLAHLAMTVTVWVVTVLFLGALGLFYSSVFRRTQAAVIAAYGTAVSLIIGSFILSLLMIEVFNRPPGKTPVSVAALAYINPVFGLAAAMGGPLGEITGLYSRVLATPAAQQAIWWKYSLFALFATVLLVAMTARRIRPYQEK
jgi:ABC-type transport system involved in multi-copper enzyme maturation permease subunit